jgi:hypothetical protein
MVGRLIRRLLATAVPVVALAFALTTLPAAAEQLQSLIPVHDGPLQADR